MTCANPCARLIVDFQLDLPFSCGFVAVIERVKSFANSPSQKSSLRDRTLSCSTSRGSRTISETSSSSATRFRRATNEFCSSAMTDSAQSAIASTRDSCGMSFAASPSG
jgi:hypothetical protein